MMKQDRLLGRLLCLLFCFSLAGTSWAQPGTANSTNGAVIDLVVKETPGERGSLTLTWYAPATLRHFVIHYRENGSDKVKDISVSDQRQFILDGIDSEQDYHISVTAVNELQQKLATSPTTDWLGTASRWRIAQEQQQAAAAAAAAVPNLDVTLRSLASNNFPFIYTTVAVDTGGQPVGGLTTPSFTAHEDGRLQTDFFDVTAPQQGGILDFIFLIDNSGSMGPEQQQVRDNIKAFVDSLVARNIDLRLGLVRFGQAAGSGQPILVNNGVMTDNVALFKSWLDQMTTDGSVEPGLLAVERAATQYSFRTGSQRHFLLITDEENNGGGTLAQAIAACHNNDVTVHTAVDCNALASDMHYCNANSIRGATNGLLFNVVGPYSDILNALTIVIRNAYIVRYRTDNPVHDGVQREVRITVNAFGQSDFVIGYYTPGAAPQIVRTPATVNLSNTAQVAGINLTIAAEITDAAAPFVQSATLYYRKTGTATYTSKPMTLTSGNVYSAVIFGSSVQTPGIDYYITATDGQVTTSDPAVDPASVPYQIAVLPNQPPQIVHTPVASAPLGQSIAVSAQVTDNTNFLSSVTLYYRRFGTLLYQNTAMNPTGGNTYAASISGVEMTLAGLQYYIRAVDNHGLASVHGPHYISPESPCITFTDDFNDGNANGWQPDTPSQWTVTNIDGDPAYCLSIADAVSDEFSVLASNRVSDFSLTLSAKTTAGDNKNFFILFGVQDLSAPKRDGYYLQFGVLGVRLYRIVANNGTEIAFHPQDFASDNAFHHIAILRSSVNLKVYGDGALLLDLNEAAFLSGYIGFGSFKSTACFDDVWLRSGGNSFSDNFNDGDAKGWQPLTPSRWQVSTDAGNPRYFLNRSDYNSPDDKRLGELSLVDGNVWGDFVFECDAKSADAAVGNPGADLSVIFGYQDFDSYYYVNFNGEPGFTEIHRIHDGGPRVTLATYNAPTFNDGNYHKLRIERRGTQILAFFDGALILSGNDGFFGQGQIGVGSFNDSGYFDNVVVNGCTVGGLPNLTATALTYNPDTFRPGDPINITGTVINDGAGSAGQDIRINVFLTDIPTEPDYTLLVHSFLIPSLPAGTVWNFSEVGTIPRGTAPNNYYLWMNVDVDNHNQETREDDNSLRTNTQLTVLPPPATIKPVVPNPVTSCAEFYVEIRVENVVNLFGLSFELHYTNTAHVNYVSTENGGFLGNDVLLYPTPDDPAGKIGIGITRKAGQPGSTGSGVVVRVKFTSPSSTPNNTPVTFSLQSITANDPANNPITLTSTNASTAMRCGISVWPGDTNNDGIVNQADVLPLGLYWNYSGPARAGGSCNWSGQLASPWTPVAATYADANGSDRVNQADVLCIGLNWNRTHSSATTLPQDVAANGLAKPVLACLELETLSAALAPGSEFEWLVLAAGADNLFGLAFELRSDRPDWIEILAAEPHAMFGDEPLFYAHFAENGTTGIGISRKAGQTGLQGEGAVLRLRGRISSTAPLGEVITLSLQNIVALEASGQQAALASSTLQLTVGGAANVAIQRSSRTVTEYRLYQNFPNPFNPETMIQYDIVQPGIVTLQIFNAVGQEVRRLLEEVQTPGAYEIRWDGRDGQGEVLSSGVYFYRLQAGDFVQIRKMALVQ